MADPVPQGWDYESLQWFIAVTPWQENASGRGRRRWFQVLTTAGFSE